MLSRFWERKMIWIASIACILAVFWVFRVMAIRKRKKFELQQKLLREENERKETERLERLMLVKQEEDKHLNTLEGFTAETEQCEIHASNIADDYRKTCQTQRLSTDDRNRMILWESLSICLSSGNWQTIQSRIGVMGRTLEKMKYPHIPIGLKEWRIVKTRYYMVCIKYLDFKIQNYKTEKAKQKRRDEILEIVEEARADKDVYHGAFEEFLLSRG